MNKSSLIENVNALLSIMQTQNYSKGTILGYRRVFNRFINYCNSSNIEEIDEMIAIQYVNKITDNKLTDLATAKTNTKSYKIYLRAMQMLEEYSRTGVFISRFSKFQKKLSLILFGTISTQIFCII